MHINETRWQFTRKQHYLFGKYWNTEVQETTYILWSWSYSFPDKCPAHPLSLPPPLPVLHGIHTYTKVPSIMTWHSLEITSFFKILWPKLLVHYQNPCSPHFPMHTDTHISQCLVEWVWPRGRAQETWKKFGEPLPYLAYWKPNLLFWLFFAPSATMQTERNLGDPGSQVLKKDIRVPITLVPETAVTPTTSPLTTVTWAKKQLLLCCSHRISL